MEGYYSYSIIQVTSINREYVEAATTDITKICIYDIIAGGIEFINPRCSCASRVTVLVCLSVCLLPRFMPLCATMRPRSDTNGFSATLGSFKKCRFS